MADLKKTTSQRNGWFAYRVAGAYSEQSTCALMDFLYKVVRCFARKGLKAEDGQTDNSVEFTNRFSHFLVNSSPLTMSNLFCKSIIRKMNQLVCKRNGSCFCENGDFGIRQQSKEEYKSIISASFVLYVRAIEISLQKKRFSY